VIRTPGFRNQDGRRQTISVACRLPSETRAFQLDAVCAAGANQGIAPRTLRYYCSWVRLEFLPPLFYRSEKMIEATPKTKVSIQTIV
jgi:hypothetical protein